MNPLTIGVGVVIAFFLILSIVTFGIWALVWDYKIHTDPENLYGDFHGIEDTVLQVVRSA